MVDWRNNKVNVRIWAVRGVWTSAQRQSEWRAWVGAAIESRTGTIKLAKKFGLRAGFGDVVRTGAIA